MSRVKSKKSGWIGVVAFLIFVAVVGGVVWFVARYTNGFNENFRTFYIEASGEKVLTAHGSVTVEKGKEQRFNVCYTFGNPKNVTELYSVKIVPNAECQDFVYRVDGNKHTWHEAETDLTKGFTVKKEATSFTIDFKELSPQTVLEKVHDGARIELSDGVDMEGRNLYALEVTSYNGKTVLRVDIALYIPVEAIDVIPGEIVL